LYTKFNIVFKDFCQQLIYKNIINYFNELINLRLNIGAYCTKRGRWLKLVDNKKQGRQYNNQQGRGKKPARIGQIQIQVVNGRRYQGVKRHREFFELRSIR